MRRVLAITVAFGLLTAGAAASASSRSARAAAPPPGVTKDEIKVGITFPDLAAVRKLGVNVNHGDDKAAYQAVIDDLDKKGGINGRKLAPVYAAVSPIGTAPAQEACVKLTEDDKVFAAIGFFNGPDGAVCYTEQHDTPAVGGTITKEFLARAKAPWYTLDASEEALTRSINALATNGDLTHTKLGIVGLAQQQGFVDIVKAALKHNKVMGTIAINDAPAGDTVAQDQQMSTIMQRFKADGITTILGVEGAVVSVGRALEKSDYRPRMIATNIGNLQAYIKGTTDPSVLNKAITAGIGRNFNDPSLQKCYKLIENATGEKIVEFPKKGEPSYFSSADGACRTVALFAAIATAAGKNLTVNGFGKAAENIGTVTIPGSGTINYDRKSHAFIQPIYISRYDPEKAKQLGIDDPTTLIQDAKPTG